jgi:hypothetical protein
VKVRAGVLLLLAAAACQSAAQRQGADAYRMLTAEVEQAARSPHGRVDLRGSRLGFDWDRLVVLPAYAGAATAERRLGFAWPEVRKSASQMQDRYQLLVFVRGDEVAAWIDYDLGKGNFGALIDRPPLPNSQALFEVHPEPGGVLRILLASSP